MPSSAGQCGGTLLPCSDRTADQQCPAGSRALREACCSRTESLRCTISFGSNSGEAGKDRRSDRPLETSSRDEPERLASPLQSRENLESIARPPGAGISGSLRRAAENETTHRSRCPIGKSCAGSCQGTELAAGDGTYEGSHSALRSLRRKRSPAQKSRTVLRTNWKHRGGRERAANGLAAKTERRRGAECLEPAGARTAGTGQVSDFWMNAGGPS